MSLKYVYICNKCKTQEIQNDDDLPSDWMRLSFTLERTRSKQISVHLCQTCREAVSIPDETPPTDMTQEEKLVALIKDIATT